MNYERKVPKRALKKLLQLRTDQFSHFDVKNKLEILAVKIGMKPVFLTTYQSNSIPELKRATALLDLKYQLTTTPPPYFSRKPNVKGSFLNAWSRSIEQKAIWIYFDIQVKPMISTSLAARLNEGFVLGYPQCCIKWHEQNRVREVELHFQDIEKYAERNPLALTDIQARTEEEIYEALLRLPFHREHVEELFKCIDEHILETYRRYPFVPHWACSSCLRGKNKETEKMNRKYEELAMNLSPKLARDVVHYVLEFVKLAKHKSKFNLKVH